MFKKEFLINLLESYGFKATNSDIKVLRKLSKSSIYINSKGKKEISNGLSQRELIILIGETVKTIDDFITGQNLENKDSSREKLISKTLHPILEIADIFDNCSGQGYSYEEPIPQQMHTKQDIYRALINKQGLIKILADSSKKEINSITCLGNSFAEKAKFLGRTYIHSLINLPQHKDDLLYVGLDTLNDWDKEDVFDSMVRKNTDIAASNNKTHKLCKLDSSLDDAISKYLSVTSSKQRRVIMKDIRDTLRQYKDLEYIANIARVGLVRIGNIYLNEGIDAKIFEASRKKPDAKLDSIVSNAMRSANIRMAAVNRSVLQTLYRRCYDIMMRLYGKPEKVKSAVIIAGSNARREFPFFDIDGTIIYSEEGKTDKGFSHNKFFESLELVLEAAAHITGHQYDPLISRAVFRAATVDRQVSYLSSPEGRFMLHMFHFMRFGAGNSELASSFMQKTNSLLEQYKEELIISRYKEARADNQSMLFDNVKYSPGGLKTIANTIIIYRLLNDNHENSPAQVMRSFNLPKEKISELIWAYRYIVNLRIRLDLHYGRNSKKMPEGEELEYFANSLNYPSSDNLLKDFEFYKSSILKITNEFLNELEPRYMKEIDLLDSAKEALQTGKNPTMAQIRALERDGILK